MKYTINFIATLGVEVEADNEDDAVSKAYEVMDMRDFEPTVGEIIREDEVN